MRRRDPNREPSSYETAILGGFTGKHVYGFTVPDAVVAQRRAKNRMARRSRQINRRRR
ncbi:hypothetical protein [Williamsia deligens]|uniref:Uncharacterized protein n=1 Tax=Williamsia deligens TaxID=321325 RepID=A0ABW3GAN6_9NOCA|nr:hypothetical protein [Williamsia deligens]MCP2196332.1 hypothetical protein [Williamsia deligens]